jgi:hypothetical protein
MTTLPFAVNVDDEVVSSDGQGLASLNNQTFDEALAFQRNYVSGLEARSDAQHPAIANFIAIERERLRQLEEHDRSAVRRKKRETENPDGTVKRVALEDVLLGQNALKEKVVEVGPVEAIVPEVLPPVAPAPTRPARRGAPRKEARAS